MLHAVKTDEDIKLTLAPGEVLVDELDATRYRVDELRGRGGMGEVYLGARVSDGAPCALKCVRGDLVHNPTIRLRTRFEAKAFRDIDHPNVVHVHATGVRADNVPWMAMEWLEGFTVADILEKQGRIPLRWAIQIVRDLCRGLHAIHAHAIHRDIKPSNVHVGLDAVVRALDLGAAKPIAANVHLTSTGFQVGTMPYMAPEQLDNTMETDARADIWAATVMLYTLMTGVHPFALGGVLPLSKIVLGYRILRDPHHPLLSVFPEAPPFFSQIIDRGLAKEPANRHRSAEELAQVLTAALDFLETKTGHAEPLSSLIDELSGGAGPVRGPRPAVLWTPPRTTEPMPQPAPIQPALRLQRAALPSPRTTQPMPAPAPRTALIKNAEKAHPDSLDQPDQPERLTMLPGASAGPAPRAATAAAYDALVDADADAIDREPIAHSDSDVRVKRDRHAEQAKPAPATVSEPRETPDEEGAPPDKIRRHGDRGGLGAPRWLVVLGIVSASLTTGEILYYFATRKPAAPLPETIVVPVASGRDGENVPVEAPTATASPTTAAAGSSGPVASAQAPPSPVPRARATVTERVPLAPTLADAGRAKDGEVQARPSASPTPTTSSAPHRLFGSEQ
jgi:serine/threonine protein kinase